MIYNTTTSRNQDLEARGAELVQRLDGCWMGDHGMCLCPAHEDRHPSLSVRVGTHALLFKCFAGCHNHDVIRAILHKDAQALQQTTCRARKRPHEGPIVSRSDLARKLWHRARPLAGSLAEAYLSRRGLFLYPLSLRFLEATPLGSGRSVIFRQAMITALHHGRELVAIQRTFFAPDRPVRARDLGKPRKMLGRPLAGAVLLAPAGSVLGLAEGTETAMSAMVLLNIPVWATLGAERFHRIAIPDTVTHLILLPDKDRAGLIGAEKALQAYARQGRTVDVIWPPNGCNDWNDALRKGEKGVGEGWRQVA